MKQLSIVILALILLTSCEPHRQTTAKRKLPAPPPLQPTNQQENAAVAALRQSAALMRELTLQADAALPDALLNRTRCFVLGLNDRAQGFSSCRSAAAPYTWSTPQMVSLTGEGAQIGNVLLFVLSDRAAEALNNGTLDVRRMSMAPGKSQKQASLLTDR